MIISSPLFSGIDEDAITDFRNLDALRLASFTKGDMILHSGEKTEEMGLVEDGTVLIGTTDPWGNPGILSSITRGQVFAESYALSGEEMMVDAVSGGESTVLFINTCRILDEGNSGRKWYLPLMRNLVSVAARKNMELSSRIFCTTARSIRERVMTYFSMLHARSGKNELTLPFNREQMAAYLSVERSALSKELGRMKRDGLIDYEKNVFLLKVKPVSAPE